LKKEVGYAITHERPREIRNESPFLPFTALGRKWGEDENKQRDNF
jgi:hypothetical protein